MATIGTGYENFVLENKMTDLVNTKLEVKSLMTVDYTLAESAGLRKTINKYTYTGAVERLAKGAKNTTIGTVTFTPKHYNVERFQQTFCYNDVDVMQDPYMLDVAMQGAAEVMSNDIKTKYFEELTKIQNKYHWVKGSNFSYAAVVDALAELDREIENDMFIIMGNDCKAAIRKDSDFIASKQGEILYSGQFGNICGLPVLFSRLVLPKTAYITKKDAIKFFVKKDASVEQDRDIETKNNTVVYERHGVIALVDETKSIAMTEAAA